MLKVVYITHNSVAYLPFAPVEGQQEALRS